MNEKILVTYATKAGSTGEVAKFIGEVLRKKGASADVAPASNVKNIADYDAIIAGSGVRAGRIYSEVVEFVRNNRAELTAVPTAFFVVCLTMKDDTPGNRAKVEASLSPLRAVVEPAAVGLFAGKMQFSTLGFLPRFIVKKLKTPEGDFRDWGAIEEWAAAFLSSLRNP